jgi:RHS repeat-associated protein
MAVNELKPWCTPKKTGGVTVYGYRHYTPKTGQFLGRDPIAEQGGLNLYEFVRNDGVNYWDVLGHNAGMMIAQMLKGAGIGPADIWKVLRGNARTYEVDFSIPLGLLKGVKFNGGLTIHDEDPKTCCVDFDISIGATWSLKKVLPVPDFVLKKIPDFISVTISGEINGTSCKDGLRLDSVGLHGIINFGETKRSSGTGSGIGVGGFFEVELTWNWREKNFEAAVTGAVGWSVKGGRFAYNWDWEVGPKPMLGSPWYY